jgi:hypothetical protein
MSQLSSFGTAFVTVFAVIFLVFRSARFGVLTIVPNVLPVLAVLGLMGYLGISMNVATIMVASVALGVVDDDTIHFINRYRREVAAGRTTDAAIEIATAHEGRASLSTALINCCGYGVLLLSEYKPTAWFGGLLALTMIVAFLAEVLILPATIKLLPRVFGADSLRRVRHVAAAMAVVMLFAGTARAQTPPSGDVTVTADTLPNRSSTAELRARIFAEEVLDPTPKLLITLSGFAEGLIARRGTSPAAGGPLSTPSAAPHRNVHDAIFRVEDASVAFKGDRIDLLAGFTRVVWGRLDELQPTDVVNPLDASRFFFEGRSKARLPVGLLRARAFVSERASVEGVYVPFFRRGRFDELDEPSSPFNIEAALTPDLAVCLAIGCPTLPPAAIVQREPSASLANGQGGARVNATSGRVDWSVSAYRGFEPFGFGRFSLPFPQASVASIDVVYPRFTMVGGDFETVRGQWGVRGEVAAFLDDNFQHPSLRVVKGTSLDAGVGADRKAGLYRISGTVLVHREQYDESIDAGEGPKRDRADISLIASADRTFSQERYQLRTFGVYNATEGSAFLRGIGAAKLRDDVALEASIGWFTGDGPSLTGRFHDSDFGYVRIKVYF